MEYRFTWLDASQIDTSDKTFRVRRCHPSSLGESIARSGIRTPLLVEPMIGSRAERFRLVSGWGRREACPPGSRLPVFVLPADLPRDAVWDLFLQDNEVWNVVEIARVLACLEQVAGLDAERITREKLPLLGVRASQDLYRQYRRLLELGEIALEFIEEARLPLRRTRLFFKLPPPTLDAIIAASRELRPTLNELTEWLGLLEDIADRDGVPADRVLEEASSGSSPLDKEKLHSYLHERRYPELHRYRSQLEECRDAIVSSLPLELRWDPRLERPGLRLTVELRERDDLQRFRRELEENTSTLGRFFEIL